MNSAVYGAAAARVKTMVTRVPRPRLDSTMLASVALFTLGLAAPALAQSSTMTFFVTSVGSGKGADLGGLAGADTHCQTLAAAAGAGSKIWHAYLSTQGAGAVNARDRRRRALLLLRYELNFVESLSDAMAGACPRLFR